jgi:two-component system CheB/CheR fusion protein
MNPATLRPSPDMRSARSLSIIVADDERDTVTTLSAILADEGHRVVETFSAVQALRHVAKQPADVLIVDISMPGASGYEVAREVRRMYGEQGPMLIAISGKCTGQTDQMLTKLAGFDYFLEKPCEPKVLVSLLAPLKRQAAKPSVSLIDDTLIPADPDSTAPSTE